MKKPGSGRSTVDLSAVHFKLHLFRGKNVVARSRVSPALIFLSLSVSLEMDLEAVVVEGQRWTSVSQ